jgi:hypothetical protein
MQPYTLRLVLAFIVSVFGLLLLTPQFGHGEDAVYALAEFDAYLPGNNLPPDLSCEVVETYQTRGQWVCRLTGGPHCESGYLIARDAVIIHTTFFRCNFPVAYLVAEYGRYENVRRYSRGLLLRWPNIYAHVKRNGWLNSMEPVSIVTWWQPPEV